MPNAVNDIHKQASAIIRAKMNNSDDIPPMPPLDDFSFALDIDEGPPFGDNTANVYVDAVAAKTRNDEGKLGQKRSSSFISEDGSQSSASKRKEAYFSLVEKAAAEGRIDTKKANRLRDCLNSDDTIHSLLTELIPVKRKGKGFYKCRICEVALKTHICPYCPVCSTPEKKFLKNDSHVCVNCVKCFDEGKKKKKLVQLEKRKCPCTSVK